MVKLRVLITVGLTLLMSTSAIAQDLATLVAERLRAWQSEGRDDRVAQLFEQLERSNPNHPVLLEAQANLAIQQGRTADFNKLLEQLQRVAPDAPETIRLTELANLDQTQRQALANARLLSLAGRYDEAYEAYQRIFPNPPKGLDLALDYWRSASQALVHDVALEGLQQLRDQYPESLTAELEWYSALLRANQLSAEQGKRVRELIAHRTVGANARQIWLRYISAERPVSARQVSALQSYTADYPDDLEAESLLRTLRESRAQEQAYAALPSTQRWQAADAALQAGNDAEALDLALDAARLSPDDPQVQGMLGYALMRNGQQRQARAAFQRAQALAPDANEWQQMVQESAFWARLETADEDAERGLTEESLREYQALLQEQPDNEAVLWGLYSVLADTLLPTDVDAWYERLSPTQQQVLVEEFQRRNAAQLAQAALDETDIRASMAMLEEALKLDSDSPWLTYQLATREADAGDQEMAKARFIALIEQQPEDADTRFAYALLLSQLEQNELALAQLGQVPSSDQSEGMRDLQQRLEIEQAFANQADLARIAKSWANLEAFNAAQLLSALSESSAARESPLISADQVETKLADYPNDIDLLLEASEYLTAIGASEEGYQLALRAIALQRQDSDVSVWETAAEDDWRTSRLRQQALSYTQANEAVLQLGFDYQNRDSTPGISSLNAQTLILELAVPEDDLFGLGAGEWFVKVDPTRIDAGMLDLTDDFVRNRYGSMVLCDDSCDLSPREQNDQGVAVGVGFRTEQWSADIGTSPLGFNESTWTGGLTYSSDWRELGWSVGAERRILSTSLLNFAGTEDPRTGATWGRVTQTGVNMSASWDEGGALGWWGSAGYDWYRGIQVADNDRWYTYTGMYWRVFDLEWLALDLGVNALMWSFDNDLSEATLGQGNYYSPQRYQSVSLPITLYGRHQRWSYIVRASFGQSRTRDNDALFFPNDPALQQAALDAQTTTFIDPTFLGGESNGFSRSISAAVEYRVNEHWYIGLTGNLQRAELYTPNNGMIYLRYHFGGFSLPPRKPPQAPIRYVDF